MATIEINVDDGILKEAEVILQSVGMDVQMAVNIFLRRVTIEKGMPMTMTAITSNYKQPDITEDDQELEPFKYEYVNTSRNNTNITHDMVDEVWNAFMSYRKGFGSTNSLSDEVAQKSGMNRGSAFIYLNILSNLISGEHNTRTLKFKDLEYLVARIKNELREQEFNNTMKSLKSSIPYWREKIPGSFADKVEVLCKKYS